MSLATRLVSHRPFNPGFLSCGVMLGSPPEILPAVSLANYTDKDNHAGKCGLYRTFPYDNDGGSNFIAFFQNDSMYLQFAPLRGSYKEDLEQNAITEQYGSQFLKYY